MIKICEYCKKEWNAARSTKRFCGAECANNFRKVLPKECAREECSVEFVPEYPQKKYCSHSCAAKATNPLRTKLKLCVGCSAQIPSSRKYCCDVCLKHSQETLLKLDKCKSCWKRTVGNGFCKEHYNEYMAEYMVQRYHARRNAFIDLRGGVCEVCGSADRLELDHIDPKLKSFDIGRILSGGSEKKVQNELAKCQVLCYSCHKKKTSAAFAEQTHCKNGHPYGERNLYVNSRGSRQCRYCLYINRCKYKSRKPKTFEEWISRK